MNSYLFVEEPRPRCQWPPSLCVPLAQPQQTHKASQCLPHHYLYPQEWGSASTIEKQFIDNVKIKHGLIKDNFVEKEN